jgi:hypothetical protein
MFRALYKNYEESWKKRNLVFAVLAVNYDMVEFVVSPTTEALLDIKMQIDLLRIALNNILETGKSLTFARDVYFVLMDLEEALKEFNEAEQVHLN